MKSRCFLPILLALSACAPSLPAPTAPSAAPSHPGFDTWRYPGDDLMNVWRQTSPYRWVGYYLAAPCHRDESFEGRRDFLVRSGWGIAVLYVGQQLFEDEPAAEITETTVCSRSLLTADRGVVDAQDAIAKTRREGFPRGTIVFLDIERMGRIAPEMVDYYRAWLRTLLADGSYLPGTYAHIANAAGLYTIAQRIFSEAGITDSAPFWIAGGSGFTLSSPPDAVGYSFAGIWQGVLDVNRTWGGRTLLIDENVARTPSPSEPAGEFSRR